MSQQRIKIRIGQVWKNNEKGMLVRVTGKHNGDYWSANKIRSNEKGVLENTGISHHISERDLWRYYKLMEEL